MFRVCRRTGAFEIRLDILVGQGVCKRLALRLNTHLGKLLLAHAGLEKRSIDFAGLKFRTSFFFKPTKGDGRRAYRAGWGAKAYDGILRIIQDRRGEMARCGDKTGGLQASSPPNWPTVDEVHF